MKLPPRPAEHLARVAGKVSPLIGKFFRELGVGARFHLYQLEEFVAKYSNATPGSAWRVLRAMRAAKALGYRLVSRTDSRYEVTDAGPDEPPTLPGVK